MTSRAFVKQVYFFLQNQPDVWCVKPGGGPFQRRGLPEIVGCCGGRFFAIGFRDADGYRRPFAIQEERLIHGANGRTLLASTIDEVKDFLSYLRALAR